jgi:hypothetical protein
MYSDTVQTNLTDAGYGFCFTNPEPRTIVPTVWYTGRQVALMRSTLTGCAAAEFKLKKKEDFTWRPTDTVNIRSSARTGKARLWR